MYCVYYNRRWRLIEGKWTRDLKLFSFMSQSNVIPTFYSFYLGYLIFVMAKNLSAVEQEEFYSLN